MKKIKHWLLIFLKGAVMGAADIVPGISGGTVALITGIYTELLESISSINLHSLKVLKAQGFFKFWEKVNGNFLLSLFCGILFSVVSFSHVINYLLATESILIWSFFFGLILASAGYIIRHLPYFCYKESIGLLVGVVVVVAISVVPKMYVPDDLFILFWGGAIAVCAMILPGISGSFILLLLGIYPIVISAISQLQWSVLLIFISGCIFGLLVFSRMLSALLRAYYSVTMATLVGFVLGSLIVVWPWRDAVGVTLTYAGIEFIWP
ncbi:MAG: DUF368 domain-containing protein, partial [Porticoccus sp.]